MNSVLNTRVRPTVVFNVRNSEHRRYAWQFMRTHTWRDCPVIFALPNGEPSVSTLIARELSEYYADLEFSSVATPQKRIRAVL